MSNVRGREEREWASRSLEDLRAEILKLRRRASERQKLEEVLGGYKRDCWRLEKEATQLQELLIEHGLAPPDESWKPPRIERLEFAAREVERLKYGISDAIRKMRGSTTSTEAWQDAQSRLDEAAADLEQLLGGAPAGPR